MEDSKISESKKVIYKTHYRVIHKYDNGYFDIQEIKTGDKNFRYQDKIDKSTKQKNIRNNLFEKYGKKTIVKLGTSSDVKTFMHWSYVKTFFDICGFDYSNLEEFLNVAEEFKVITPPVIKDYEWDDSLTVQVHFETGYINADKLCKESGVTEKDFLSYITNHNILEAYYKKDNGNEFTGVYSDLRSEFITDNLHKNSTTWISERMLPVLMMFCNPHYVVFVSDIMLMYHKDPIKLIPALTQKMDTENDTITTLVMQTTSADKPEEAIENAKNNMEYIISDAKGKDETPLYEDIHGNKQSEQDFRASATKLIQSLRGRITYFSDMNTSLTLRLGDMDEQFAPVRELLNDHPGVNVAQLALTRKEMLDKNVFPLERQLEEKELMIKTLQGELYCEKQRKHEAHEELSITQGTYEGEMDDLNDYIQHLEDGYAPKRNAKASKASKTPKTPATPKAFRPERNSEVPGVSSASPPQSCSHLSIYTKRDYEGDHIALVPGRSINFKKHQFAYRGVIKLNEKRTAEQYLELFAKNNRHSYKKQQGLTFSLEHKPEVFERVFSAYFGDDIISKTNLYEYNVGKGDAVCCY
jgi:vacuolar-type H+-ATPase subunit H